MKKIITFSIIALFFAACAQNTPEANEKKATALKQKIAKMEKQLEAVQNPADTVVVEKFFNVKIKPLSKIEIDNKIEYSANLIPSEELYMAPAQPGKITKIYVEIGDNVMKGQKLVQMDDTQLEQTKIQLHSVQKDYDRIKTLKESGSIAEQQYDQIKTQLDVLKSNVEFLEENTVLIAPFNGVITGKYFEDSESFSGGPNTQAGKAAIVTLQQINTLKAVINISEKYYASLTEGTKVNLVTDIFPNEIFDGEIKNIYPTIDPMTRSFMVEINIPNWKLKLRPGMFSRVNIILGQANAMLVPSHTILQQEGTNNRYVFIEDNGVAKRVNVEIGARFDELIEIISDELKVGDHLIVAGQTVLMDNNKVKVVN